MLRRARRGFDVPSCTMHGNGLRTCWRSACLAAAAARVAVVFFSFFFTPPSPRTAVPRQPGQGYGRWSPQFRFHTRALHTNTVAAPSPCRTRSSAGRRRQWKNDKRIKSSIVTRRPLRRRRIGDDDDDRTMESGWGTYSWTVLCPESGKLFPGGQ